MNTNLTKQAIDEFLNGTQTLTEISKKYRIDYDLLVTEIRSRGYIFRKGYSSSTTLNLKSAIDEYLSNEKPSLTKISKKYSIGRNTLSKSVKELGYNIENHQNKSEFDYKLGYNNRSTQTRVLSLFGKNGFELVKYLYSNCTIYLDRKYEKYLEYCRLYEESYRGLEGKNGESCDGNTVLNSEITKGSESV